MNHLNSTSPDTKITTTTNTTPPPPPPPQQPPSIVSGTDESNNKHIKDEWVEIVEPKSKKRIYANLETGVCAKYPPEKAIVSRAEDFSDHWWELYDKKTGKYYYYNPEQQKTAWTRPKESPTLQPSNGNNDISKKKRLLIIPVSKLQTFKKLSSNNEEHVIKVVEKLDASTQTIASNLVSTGTQTISESVLEDEFNDKLKFIDNFSQNDYSNASSSSCTHSSSATLTTTNSNNSNYLNHRQSSDFNGKERDNYIIKNNQLSKHDHNIDITRSNKQLNLKNRLSLYSSSENKNIPSHNVKVSNNLHPSVTGNSLSNDSKNDNYLRFRTHNSTYQQQKESSPISLTSPGKSNASTHSNYLTNDRLGHSTSSTSTFGNPLNANSSKPPLSSNRPSVSKQTQPPSKMTTNNLSHYLVREARAMGIALISDDELDDDQDSDEDFNGEFDEDTDDMRDDLSSHGGGVEDGPCSDFFASQDLCENSSEPWKSFSDQDSLNSSIQKSAQQNQRHLKTIVQKSPIHCETSEPSSFQFNELIDDQKNPASCMSQQLDHRKLVENFKKSRQTSSFGLHDSLGRTYKIDPNQAVQRMKTVADNYFSHDKEQPSDKQLRQLSTLSTLPRLHKETKDKIALSKPEDSVGGGSGTVDADYDVVEENCGYYSDSEQQNQQQLKANSNYDPTTKLVNITSSTNANGEPPSPVSTYFDRTKSSRGSTFSVESFARENLSRHAKGGLLFNRKVKWSSMITWTKNSIKQPMISSVSSDLTSDSITSFKLIQQFMGDRKLTVNKKYRQLLSQSVPNNDQQHYGTKGKSGDSAHGSQSSSSPLPDRLRDELAYELVVKGCTKSALRDEIYIQMARQLTENPSQESVGWGLILISILLSYFSPSSKFSPFLLTFLEMHPHQMARDVCLPRLEKRLRLSGLTYCRKPADGKEISIVRLSITKWPQYCGVFGESLEKIMSLQSCSPYMKTLRLPWILTTLGKKLLETGGAETEGIFRCAADHDLISQLRLEIDCVDFRKILDAKQVHSLLSNVQDPHVIAGLLKLFFRQLNEPVFSSQIYELCLQSGQEGGQLACRVFNERLSNLKKDVVAYLIRLLQLLAQPDKVSQTKMDNSNLSMIWAPNLLRAPECLGESQFFSPQSGAGSNNGSKWSIANLDDHSTGTTSANNNSLARSQSTIFEQTRQEMQFIRSLIIHLDTSFIEDVV